MSTPSTLVQTVPHQHLDHHRYLPSPQDRFLPPPRPSSNLSNGYHHNPLPSIPARPSSNLNNRQLPRPPQLQSEGSGMSTAAYPQQNHPQSHRHSHSQSHAGSEYSYPQVNGLTHDELRRTHSRSSQQHSRQLPPPPMLQHQHQHQQQQHQQHLQASPSTRALPAVPADAMPPAQYDEYERRGSSERGRRRKGKSPVDWVAFFGGKPPTEIIEIHDDDSPAPQATIQRLPPPVTNGAPHSHHVDKKRRVNGSGGGEAGYSTTNTPYSYTNGTSTDSLQNTTAPTSLGSQASTAGRIDNTQSAGQKRKRTTRTSDALHKKEEAARAGPQGYLAEYGEYHPPTKLSKKQKDVVVPTVHDVGHRLISRHVKKTNKAVQRNKPSDKIDDEDGHYIVHENSRLGEKYNLLNLLGQGTFGKVVRAIDIRNRKEVAVKIIRAVPKVRFPHPPPTYQILTFTTVSRCQPHRASRVEDITRG